jgi:AraC family transcriptional regulator, regulatory protein of adaptative response / methylated-DNA-[protein]-cysteine methyltransferase
MAISKPTNLEALAHRPTVERMYQAVVDRDASFEGVFVTAVKTTGIFCRPGCTAKTPRRENVEFFGTPAEALHAGYRACKRCTPMEPVGATPRWVQQLFEFVEQDPTRRISADDLRKNGVHPAAASRYFKSRYGMTFQAYSRARRVGVAMRTVREGGSVARAALESGYLSESGLREAFVRLFGEPPVKAARESGAVRRGDVSTGEPMLAKWLTTPMGPMLAVANDEGLCLLEFIDRRAIETQVAVLRRRFGTHVVPGENAILAKVEAQAAKYFEGKSATIDVPLAVKGTAFQEAVWRALRRIPPGQTRSYAEIAKEIGRPTAVRAVARANGDNRLAIVIPCHRVIGSDGSMTGYGGGVWRKEWLLEHERRWAGLGEKR